MTANDTPTTDTAQDTTNAPVQDAQAPSTPEQDPTPQEAPTGRSGTPQRQRRGRQVPGEST